MSRPNYPPVDVMDRLEGNRHIVMFYDEDRHRDLLIAHYFQNGLLTGATCVFHTGEDPEVCKAKLAAHGLDAAKYSKAGRLHIVDPNAAENRGKSRLATSRAGTAAWTQGMRGPFRVAAESTLDPDLGRDREQHILGEEITQAHFTKLDMSLLCLYDLRKLAGPQQADWVRGLLGSHDQVIYASRADKAVAFDTDLLEEAD